MTRLPTGTVTFLFTDVEGSTKLLEELGPAGYAEMNEVHRRAVREAIAAHGGVEVSTHGDAFFVVFTDATAAVRGAIAAQEALKTGRIRVRMGLHSGTAVVADDTYVGMDVNHAARIGDAGHGGQILVSPVVYESVREGVEFRDLGTHRLKDLGEPLRLYQVGDATFPALRTLSRSNLPVPPTPFVGREDQLTAVTGLLRRDDVRVTTLTGPGGTGKSRLALQASAEVADAFPDGIFWVPLAPIRDPALVLATVIEATGVATSGGTRAGLLDALATKRLLLTLDNAEHLMPDVVRDIGAIVSASEHVTVLVTSRERLRVDGEHVHPVPPMEEHDAVGLFLERALAHDPAFVHVPAVDEICRQLDHLPLAIELAAARVGLLTAEQLLDRLGRRLDLLKGSRDADPRQHTLRATIAWSYDLLDPDECRAFARISVFAGGATLEMIEDVCDADIDVVESLLDKSLLRRRNTEEGARLSMLETIRQFAVEQLEASGEADEVRARHFDRFLALARQTSPDFGASDEEALLQLDAERDNLRVASAWQLEHDPNAALELVTILGTHLWIRRSAWREGTDAIRAALDAALDAPALDRARATLALGQLALGSARLEAARSYTTEALSIFEGLQDARGAGRSLNLLGMVSWYGGDLDEATRRLEGAIDVFEAAGDTRARGGVLSNLGGIRLSAGDHAGARDILRDAVATAREQGRTKLETELNNLGLALEGLGDPGARAAFEESVTLCRAHHDTQVLPMALMSLAHLELRTDATSALERYRESLSLLADGGDERGMAYAFEGIARCLLDEDPELSASLLSRAAEIRSRTGAQLTDSEREEVDQAIETSRRALREERFAPAWERGRRMPMEAAVDAGLGRAPSPPA